MNYLILPIINLFLLLSCLQQEQVDYTQPEVVDKIGFADVLEASASGENDQYTLAVTIKSPDIGCEQYADWWEVISEEGELLYRRISQHNHVNEQPFTRLGEPVNITTEQIVWIRAHMKNIGYGGKVFKGSIKTDFKEAQIHVDFVLV